MFKKWLRRLWWVLVLSTAAAWMGLLSIQHPEPSGQRGDEAERLFERVLRSTHASSWKRLTFVLSWRQGAIDFTWSKTKNQVLCRWEQNKRKHLVLLKLDTQQAQVVQSKKPVTNPQATHLARRCYQVWHQSLRSMNPIAHLSALKPYLVKRGSQTLLMLRSRAKSPQPETHLFHLNKDDLPIRWQQWGPQTLLQGMMVTLQPWQKYPNQLWVCLTHQSKLGTTKINDVRIDFKPKNTLFQGRLRALQQAFGSHVPHVKVSRQPAVYASSLHDVLMKWAGFLALWGVLLLAWSWRKERTLTFPSPTKHPMRYGYIVPKQLPVKLCKELIHTAEEHGWTEQRHTQPTRDIPLQDLGCLGRSVNEHVQQNVFPVVAKKYDLQLQHIKIRECFVVKYDAERQSKLDLHRDASLLTAIFALNPSSDYQGGGTYFPSLGDVVMLPNAGDLLLHCGKLQHGGYTVKQGRRYLLVCFLDLSACPEFQHEEIQQWNSAEPSDQEVMQRLYKPSL
ncbi:MAG: hypothetical protein EP343_32700 [Deltaproteobacteria bacterium]|nr:MAG: hypothetical protein EP343_32700 [Deltaproteobacteria bacterium]